MSAEATPLPNGTGCRVDRNDDGIVTVTFDRPDTLNAMTQGLKRDLIELCARIQMDDSVRVVIFTGEGRAFCAGDNLGGYHGEPPATVPVIAGGHDSPIGTTTALRVYSQAVNNAIRNLDKPTVAAINGPAIQTGLSLALSCDFRVASTQAKLGSATLRFALLPDEGGHALLIQHLGLARALDFVLRARIVDADTALAMGLVNEVVTPDKLMPAANELAAELARGPQVAMRLLKRSMYLAAESSFQQALDDIAVRTAIVDHHPDAREGVAAFAQKRAAVFNQEG